MTACLICAYADVHGSWPPSHRGTHCADTDTRTGIIEGCHRSWRGLRESHCTVCHAHFSGDKVGDAHRVNGVCLTREEMLATRRESGKPVFRTTTTPNGEMWRSAETLDLKPTFLARDPV